MTIQRSFFQRLLCLTLREQACALAALLCLYGITGPVFAQSADERSRIVDIPLAAVHSEIGFAIWNQSTRKMICEENNQCLTPENSNLNRFILQVQRISQALQAGADEIYPDMVERYPGMTGGRFDIFVVEGHDPGSASSSNGKIALNTALGEWQPYDEWLAFVIAREMGHVISRHHEENSASSIATSLIMNVLIPGSGLLKAVVSAGSGKIASLSNHDVQELEADMVAFRLLKASGFGLTDTSLALSVAPVYQNQSTWTQALLRSKEKLALELRASRITLAAAFH